MRERLPEIHEQVSVQAPPQIHRQVSYCAPVPEVTHQRSYHADPHVIRSHAEPRSYTYQTYPESFGRDLSPGGIYHAAPLRPDHTYHHN